MAIRDPKERQVKIQRSPKRANQQKVYARGL